MNRRTLEILATACASVLVCSVTARAADKINFEDHLMPILRNECASCHNPDKKKAGLDLSTYQGLLAGSDNGPVVNPGDADASLLYKVVARTEEPYMPKGKAKLADKDIELFKQFIAGGALENATGKPTVVRARPKLNLSVAASDSGKPTGPVAMPRDLILEPVSHTARPGALLCLATSPWAPLAAVGGQHQMLMYNTDTLELVGVLPWPEGEPYTARFSRNGSVLLVGGGIAAKSGHVVLFDVASGKRITQIGDEFDAVIAADIAPDLSMVAFGGPSKTLKVFSTDGQSLHSIKKHTDWVTAVGFSPDGVLLASGDRQGGLWVWESKSGHDFYGLTGHKGAITDVCFRGDSNILASASEDGTVKLWDMQSGKEVKSFQANAGGVESVHFTHDGRIVTCGRDKVVRMWTPDGSAIAATNAFADIALHAAFDGEGKRVVAGDWRGSIRVFDAATAKPIGELSSDPPAIADRLDAASKRIPDAQAAFDKAAAELANAQKASDKSAADLQAANLASAEAKKSLEQAKAQEKALADAIDPARAAQKAAEDTIPGKQADVDHLTQALAQATAARETAEREKKALAEAVVAKQKASDDAAHAAETAKTDADKTPGNIQLASAEKDAKSTADRLAQELVESQKSLGGKGDQVSALNEQMTKAQVQADQARAALTAAREQATARQAALAKLQADRQAAVAVVTKAQQAVQDSDKLIPQRTQDAKAAAEQLSKVKPVADQAAQQLGAARLDVAKLKAAQFNLTVWAARNELAAKQTDLDKLTQAADETKAALEKSTGDLAATQKLLVEGPQQIAAKQDELAKAKLALAVAATARDAAGAVLNDRQSLAQQSADLAQKFATAAAKTPDDKTLADAAAKAKSALDAINGNLEPLKVTFAARDQSAKDAQAAVASAESALARQKADIEGAPKAIEGLKQTIAAASADLPRKKAAADEFAKTITFTKAHVDELAAQYQKLSQEASVAPAPAGTPKG
jgi:hypothetical protein